MNWYDVGGISPLAERFEKLEGSYEEFIVYLPVYAKACGVIDELNEYLDKNPNATPSDVIEEFNTLAGYDVPEQFRIE